MGVDGTERISEDLKAGKVRNMGGGVPRISCKRKDYQGVVRGKRNFENYLPQQIKTGARRCILS